MPILPRRLAGLVVAVLLALPTLPAQTIQWDSIGWNQNQAIAPELTPYFDQANHVKNPFSGLGSSSGGVNNFASQSFTDVAGSGVDMTVYHSRNNYDGSTLEGPDLYNPVDNENPDRRVTGESALRVTRDNTLDSGIYHPVTVVLSFSQPVTFEEFLLGSLSVVGSSNENVVVRAFASDDATGPVVKASAFRNVSDLQDGSTLLHGQWDTGGPDWGAVNELSNIDVDPDLTLDANGVATDVGDAGDDGIYHIIGMGNQNDRRYGRAVLEWDTPVQSVAASFFPSSGNDFDSYDPTDQWVSAILAPYTFTPVPEPSTGLLLLPALLAFRRRR
jgi:hypothetical protein